MRNYENGHNSLDLSVDRFLDNPTDLRHILKEHGALEFVPYESGLFPASNLSSEMRQATGMGMAWFRDNAHVAWALHEAGETELAAGTGRAMLSVLANNRDILENATVAEGAERRLPVRVEGDTLANDTEARSQNDSTGYALWLTSRLINEGTLRPRSEDLNTLAATARYLGMVKYWQDEDEGHWEEDRRLQASSIGVVVAGLREAQRTFDQAGYISGIDIDRLVSRGRAALEDILSQGVTGIVKREVPRLEIAQGAPYPTICTPEDIVRGFFEKFSVNRREHDAALLFLVEPLRVFEGAQAETIVTAIERELRRDTGVARYSGDTYWEPRFPSIMNIEERTTQAEGRTEKRNQTAAGIAYSDTEAQWTLFDPVLSTYWGRRYQETGDIKHRERQLEYLQRSLDQLAVTPDGEWQLPEAYYLEYNEMTGNNQWIPNDHMPLLWSQANLLGALKTFESSPQRLAY